MTRLDGCYLVGHDIGFLIVAKALDDRNLVADIIMREDMLPNLIFILVNQRVGSLDDGLSRAVVSFQFVCHQVGIELLESQDVGDISTTKRVDALRVVAHNTQAVVLPRELHHYHVLGKVGVLILIDKDILEHLLVFV